MPQGRIKQPLPGETIFLAPRDWLEHYLGRPRGLCATVGFSTGTLVRIAPLQAGSYGIEQKPSRVPICVIINESHAEGRSAQAVKAADTQSWPLQLLTPGNAVVIRCLVVATYWRSD